MPENVQTDSEDGILFSIYIGMLAVDKEFSSPIIKVTAPSIMPFLGTDSGEGFSGANLSADVSVNDLSNDIEIQEEVITKNYIDAVYFNLHTNRELPPDVRKGEQVLLLRIQNTDVYYWLSLGRDDGLRRCERMKLRVSDDTTFNKELTDDNTYYIDLDTLLHKHIWIRTSKSNGEAYRYQIKIDSEKNHIHISDDIKNEIILESDKHRIFARNTDGSFLDILGVDIHMHAERQMLLTGYELHTDFVRVTNTSGVGCSNFRENMSEGYPSPSRDDRVNWNYGDYTNKGNGGVDSDRVDKDYK